MSPERPRRSSSGPRNPGSRPQGKRDGKKSEWWSEKQGQHKKHGGHSANDGPPLREKRDTYEPREPREPREFSEPREQRDARGGYESPRRGEGRQSTGRRDHGPRREGGEYTKKPGFSKKEGFKKHAGFGGRRSESRHDARPAVTARRGDREEHRFETTQRSPASEGVQDTVEEESMWVVGRHEVAALLKANRPIEAIVIAESAHGEAIREIREEAHRRRLKLQVVPVLAFRRIHGDDTQGVAAKTGAFEYVEFDALLDACEKKPEAVLVALNHVEDPRNLGAVVRTVEAAGASGIIIPRERAAAMTIGAIRTAQGAASHLPVAKVVNLGVAIENAKKRGFWVVGLDGEAPKRYDEVRYTGRVLLVAGGEDVGLGVRIGGACDERVSIPLCGKTPSLNVSVSTAIALFEILRQKGFAVGSRCEK